MIKGEGFTFPNYTGILCRDCYESTFVCSVCGKQSDRIILKSSGYSVCRDCEQRASLVCRSCGTPVDSDNLDEDDIPVCSHCKGKGIISSQDLYNVVSIVYRFMEKHFEYDFRSIPLRMATPEEMKIHRDDSLGFAEHSGHSGKDEIAVIRYTPKEKARYFLVHELTHCWQFSRRLIADNNNKLVEGFAVWMETFYAASIDDSDHIRSCLRNPDSVYGGGYRVYYDLERKLGADFVLSNAEKFHRSEQLINLTQS